MSNTVLVVDDSVDTRELLHLYLKSSGYTVFVAADGGEGLYRIEGYGWGGVQGGGPLTAAQLADLVEFYSRAAGA